ncbi:MAG: cell division protein FtsZ [Armatimonadota bacterium]
MAKHDRSKSISPHGESPITEWAPCIKVVGVGGAGSNAVNRMVEVGLQNVEFIAMNTDAQVLPKSHAPIKLQLGRSLCRGLGAGGDPSVGRSAAEENRQEIRSLLENADMVFVTAGMGGGTGTGASPIVTEIARELGALTVAVVTYPFSFEGPTRARNAKEGIRQIKECVDALIVIRNDRLLAVAEHNLPVTEAYRLADDVLRYAVQGIVDVIQSTGYINVDFADVRTILKDAGTAMMGIGKGTGENALMQAVHEALNSKLHDSTIAGARGILVNITSGESLSIQQVNEVLSYLSGMANSEACEIFYGQVLNSEMRDVVQVTIIATGFPEKAPDKAVVLPHQQDPHPLEQIPNPRLSPNPSTPSRSHDRTFANPTDSTTHNPELVNREIPAFLRRRNPPVS